MTSKQSIALALADSFEKIARENQLDDLLVVTYALNFAIQYMLEVSDDKEVVQKYVQDLVDRNFNPVHKVRTLH